VTWRNHERRGCLRTDLVLGKDTVLHVFDVHLRTSYIERRHQARTLLSDEVLNRKECRAPRIVVGDFNEWARGLAWRLMRDAFEVVEPSAFLHHAHANSTYVMRSTCTHRRLASGSGMALASVCGAGLGLGRTVCRLYGDKRGQHVAVSRVGGIQETFMVVIAARFMTI